MHDTSTLPRLYLEAGDLVMHVHLNCVCLVLDTRDFYIVLQDLNDLVVFKFNTINCDSIGEWMLICKPEKA